MYIWPLPVEGQEARCYVFYFLKASAAGIIFCLLKNRSSFVPFPVNSLPYYSQGLRLVCFQQLFLDRNMFHP